MAAGAQMVKLEGGEIMLETVRFLTERGIPRLCAYRSDTAIGASDWGLSCAGQGVAGGTAVA